MECLRDYIGLKGCGQADPASGLLLNSLPGISTFMVTKIIDSDQVTYLNVWRDVQNRALKKFQSSVIATFKKVKSQRIKTVTHVSDLGRLINDDAPLAATAQWRGVTVELMFPGLVYTLESSLQVIFVQSISLYSAEAVEDLEIKVFDLDTGATLDTFTQDVAAGWNLIRIATSYDAFRIFIAYDATEIDSVKLDITPSSTTYCQICADHIFGHGECTAKVQGAVSVDLATPTEIVQGNDVYGLSAIFSIQCRYDWVVCSNLEIFSNAWLYLLGAEMMTERIYSERVNRFTTIDIDSAVSLRNEYLAEFDRELSLAINGIDISDSDCCIECEAMIQKPYAIP